jgi:hypothetical protein
MHGGNPMTCFVLLSSGVFMLVTPLAQAQANTNEAETLFRKMQEKIKSTKSLKVTVEQTITAMGPDRKQVWTIWMADPDKFGLECEYYIKGVRDSSAVEVGHSRKSAFRIDGETITRSTPNDNVKGDFKDWLAHHGLYGGWLFLNFRSCLGSELIPVNTAFKLGAREKIGARLGQAVHYKMTLANFAKDRRGTIIDAVKITLTVWIDTQTHLPLKRVVEANRNKFEELYQNWQLNPKLDPKLFELPK